MTNSMGFANFFLEKDISKSYIGVILVFSGIFTILGYFKIGLEFYIWEFLIDLKISIIFAILAYIIYRRGIKNSLSDIGFRSFNWKTSLFFFLLPLFLSAVILLAGYFSGSVKYVDPDNPTTQLLGVLFDIPAICFFSLPTIMLEEVVFRGGMVNLFSKQFQRIRLVVISTVLWGAYSVPRIFISEGISLFSIFSLMLFWISIGFFCVKLFVFSNSIWNIYFFRIGIMIFLPLFLGNFSAEMDPFFEAKSRLFLGDGMIIAFLLISASFLFKKYLKKPTN